MPLPSFCGCAVQFESTLVKNPEDRLSHDVAHMIFMQSVEIYSELRCAVPFLGGVGGENYRTP